MYVTTRISSQVRPQNSRIRLKGLNLIPPVGYRASMNEGKRERQGHPKPPTLTGTLSCHLLEMGPVESQVGRWFSPSLRLKIRKCLLLSHVVYRPSCSLLLFYVRSLLRSLTRGLLGYVDGVVVVLKPSVYHEVVHLSNIP